MAWTREAQAGYERDVRVLTSLLVKPQKHSTKRKCVECDEFKSCSEKRFKHSRAFVCADCSPSQPEAASEKDRGWRVI
jgi:hypothetical protein